MNIKLNIVILAAGEGKRMNSSIPKVMHKIGNNTLLEHVINKSLSLSPEKLIIIYGHEGDKVKSHINESYPNNNFILVKQGQQLGTGHALKCAISNLTQDAATLVLYADVPLISLTTLNKLVESYLSEVNQSNLVVLTGLVANPTGYGRIIRDFNSQIVQIVEEKDATETEKVINEINSGIYLLPNQYLPLWLNSLTPNNNQQEYYLTDVIKYARENSKVKINSVTIDNSYEIMGVNNKTQLEYLERRYQEQLANGLLTQGVTLKDKTRIDIRGELTTGRDCVIDINCVFEGKVVLGNNVTVGSGAILKDVVVGDNVNIKPYSLIDGAKIGDGSQIGPFSRIRPGTNLNAKVHIGNFVEVKNSTIDENSKANHLTYIGDATVGSQVNIGAGSVTCNYNGFTKHKTVIENNVFIGSGSMLVAPVVIGEGGIIGAGSTISKDTEPNELTVARAKQQTIKGWLSQWLKFNKDNKEDFEK